MILIWGLPGDSSLGLVRNRLAELGAPVTFLNQHRTLSTEVWMKVRGGAGAMVGGTLQCGDDVLQLADVRAFYLRPYESIRLPSIARLPDGDPARERATTTEDILLSFADITEALVVNRPTAMCGNSSKPFQGAWIERFGLHVPQTLITTDPQAVRAFHDVMGALIYKSVSGVRSMVSRLDRLDDDRLASIVWCPTQFQELVRGVDYRVHVVGSETFACRVQSEADDYRYASRSGQDVAIDEFTMPDHVTQACVLLAKDMDLPVAGVDLRQREDGRWYCFEVNPSPAFAYYQRATGQDIAMAIAKMLARADHADHDGQAERTLGGGA